VFTSTTVAALFISFKFSSTAIKCVGFISSMNECDIWLVILPFESRSVNGKLRDLDHVVFKGLFSPTLAS
jgi:hypothetical protein